MKLNFQNAASPLMEQLLFFHDWSMLYVAAIATAVLWYLALIMQASFTNRFLVDAQNVEFFWTTFPCLVLIAIAMPSLKLLYMIDESGQPTLTLKAIGHQWYWSYEFSDLEDLEFDSYLAPTIYRLLDVDNRILLPTKQASRVLVTAADVLHSWTVPALGVKADAVPGRLNSLNLIVERSGVYYGQCSEICGSNHSFMPISLESVPTAKQ